MAPSSSGMNGVPSKRDQHRQIAAEQRPFRGSRHAGASCRATARRSIRLEQVEQALHAVCCGCRPSCVITGPWMLIRPRALLPLMQRGDVREANQGLARARRGAHDAAQQPHRAVAATCAEYCSHAGSASARFNSASRRLSSPAR